MRNWLGQDIQVGTPVYRGAREGNTSSYKVGRVTKVNDQTRKVTVKWRAEPSYQYVIDDHDQTENVFAIRELDSTGTSHIDTLVVIDEQAIVRAEAYAEVQSLVRHANLPTRRLSSQTNPSFPGYVIKGAYNEFIRYELAQRGITL